MSIRWKSYVIASGATWFALAPLMLSAMLSSCPVSGIQNLNVVPVLPAVVDVQRLISRGARQRIVIGEGQLVVNHPVLADGRLKLETTGHVQIPFRSGHVRVEHLQGVTQRGSDPAVKVGSPYEALQLWVSEEQHDVLLLRRAGQAAGDGRRLPDAGVQQPPDQRLTERGQEHLPRVTRAGEVGDVVELRQGVGAGDHLGVGGTVIGPVIERTPPSATGSTPMTPSGWTPVASE